MVIYQRKFGEFDVFPQANDIYKVIKIVELIGSNITEESVIMEALAVTAERQIQYYISAAQFLGLLDSKKTVSEVGALILGQKTSTRLELITYLILSGEMFSFYYRTRDRNNTVFKLINELGLSESTANRRYSTIEQWVEWCDIIVNDYKINIEFKEAT